MATSVDRILVLIEQGDEKVSNASFGLLNAGKQLAGRSGALLCACVMGHQIGDVCEEISACVDEVYAVDKNLLSAFQADLYASALESVCKRVSPTVLLLTHSYENYELAPKIGYRMESEVITDCTGIEREETTGALLCSKPIYGGNAIAVLELREKPQIVTIRSKVYEPLEKGSSHGRVIPVECELDLSCVRVRSMKVVPGQNVNLDKADSIVSAGRGVRTQEGIDELQRLARALEKYFDKAEIGASRPVVDAGLLAHSRQVGLTGEKVSPQLYIAVAISGATQHASGMTGSRKIIAVNKDPEAPIFGVSDYGVVGSFEEVIPAFIDQLEALS
jgi:electron transfer flavoprotein alpha subunit